MTTSSPEPLRIADHPALDLINTITRIETDPTEFLHSGLDVQLWLQQLGFAPEDDAKPPARLLESTRALREVVRELVQRRKAGKDADPTALNEYLAHAAGHPQLVWPTRQAPQLARVLERKTALQWLAPLAESAADLLVNGNFELVRECEHPDCTLWFYDRTKSHRRRWCSMAMCGNRNKVAAFRQRNAVA